MRLFHKSLTECSISQNFSDNWINKCMTTAYYGSLINALRVKKKRKFKYNLCWVEIFWHIFNSLAAQNCAAAHSLRIFALKYNKENRALRTVNEFFTAFKYWSKRSTFHFNGLRKAFLLLEKVCLSGFFVEILSFFMSSYSSRYSFYRFSMKYLWVWQARMSSGEEFSNNKISKHLSNLMSSWNRSMESH